VNWITLSQDKDKWWTLVSKVMKVVFYKYRRVSQLVEKLFVSRAERQVDLPPCMRNNVHKYRICCHNNIIMKLKHV